MERSDASSVVQASAACGALFKTVDLETEGARNLLKAVTANVGLLAPDTTLDQAQALLAAGLASYGDQSQQRESDEVMAEVIQRGTPQTVTAD
eukprot:2315695-Amphidinium_carterae.2